MKAYQKFAEKLSKLGRGSHWYELDRGRHKIPGLVRLGSGASRATYVHPKFPFLVFKVGKSTTNPANKDEWEFYTEEATDKQRQALARPFYLSKNSRVLVMERVQTGPYEVKHNLTYFSSKGWEKFYEEKDKFEDRLHHKKAESFLRNLMPARRQWDFYVGHNIGLVGDRVVLYDYATSEATWAR